MAKSLKDILKGVKASKVEKGSLGKDPGVDYEPKSKDEQDFVAKHEVEKHEHRSGNKSDVSGSDKIKHSLDDKKNDKMGHKHKEAKATYEAKEHEEAKCNESAKGTHCPVHGMAECMSVKKINEADVPTPPARPAPTPPARPKDLDKKKDDTQGGQLAKTGMRTFEEVEQVDEISKKTAYGAYADRAMSDDWDKADSLKDKIVKKWGKKAGDDAESHAHASVYGRSEPGKKPEDHFKNADKLSDILSRTSPMRITKSGVANKQDQKSNANKIKARLGSHKEPNLPEEVELDEKLTKSMSAGDVIHDFVHSDNPKFEGKSKKKRMQMALAAYYAKKREKKN